MRGWIILDGLVGFGGLSAVISGLTSSAGIKSVIVVALSLLALSLMTKAVRGRA
jgi:hypothetical protein